MKNTGNRSRKSNLLTYLLFFLLLSSLIIGGIYWYYTEEDRKLAHTLAWIKDENIEYKELENNSIVASIERSIQEKKYIVKKLNNNVNLSQKSKIKFKKLLEEIDQEEIDQETLENKTKEERKEIIRKVLITKRKLDRLKWAIKESEKDDTETNKYIKEQEEWLKKFYPFGWRKEPPLSKSEQTEEDKEIRLKLNDFIKTFFKKFIIEKNLSEPNYIQLVREAEGKKQLPPEPSLEKIKQETQKLKNRFPKVDVDKKMRVKFNGFQGWHGENDGEEGGIAAGLTLYNKSEKLTEDKRFNSCEIRYISITLHKNFPFSRKGKEYYRWITKNDQGIGDVLIGWDNLIETIAHELAHAVINFSRVHYRTNKKIKMGGHGILHSKYTRELHLMIKNNPKYRELKEFWFSKN